MVKPITEADHKPSAWLFLEVMDEEVLFYQRFVARHGGAFTAIDAQAGSYRLDLPNGTRRVPNEEEGLPLEESYHLVYPDGTRITWYREMKLDGRPLHDVLLVRVESDEEWTLFEGEPCDEPAG